jgi:4-alpha-glucanotransferase
VCGGSWSVPVRESASSRFAAGRHLGVLVPLFSIPSSGSWGIGEIPDLARFAKWVDRAGMDIVQILPVNEMPDGQNSPYSALSAMAIDPIFISLSDVEEYAAADGGVQMSADDLDRLEQARCAPAIVHPLVRALKQNALRAAFTKFNGGNGPQHRSRTRRFQDFMEREAWWLEDYALFRALHEENQGKHWLDWPRALREREPSALSDAAARLEKPIRYYKYVQWLADDQWQDARSASAPVGIFGDFPFMVSAHSADVWVRQKEFRVDASVGVPPDAFSETGQDWGLPVYRWDVIAGTGYQWLRDRARRCAELYDGFRVDHVVGFFRTFVRERDKRTTSFVPAKEAAQRAQGEALLELFGSCGSRIVAEDLGTVPDFVRKSLSRHGVPGMQVLRWEREWASTPQRFRDPAGYPQAGVATTGTHDTETMAEWWDGADDEERGLLLDLPALQSHDLAPDLPYSDVLRDALLRMMVNANSDFVIFPIQDIFGWRDRINTPASINDANWTWRLPMPVDELTTRADAVERAQFLRAEARRVR